MKKRYHTIAPDDLNAAVEEHARAIAGGDGEAAAAFVEARARQAHEAALARISALGRIAGFEIIARARLGFHYLVKVRFHGASGGAVALQNRWRQEDGPKWRIAEVDDLGVQSPWKKPDKPMVNADA